MSVREKLSENLGFKALALFLAMALWLFVTAGTEGEVALTVPVQFRNIPPQLSPGSKAPPAVELKIAGPRILLWQLAGERLAVTLDLQGVGEGSVAFTSLERTVRLRSGLRITRIQPSAIELQLVRQE
ncbi:MAG: CdaR family protein [Geobacteraceae bacterium]|nr:CdaR family protein [Geobacteraceae bacterium]